MSKVITLKDAKGYRSTYINNLNEAVKRYHVIGGDVTAVESEAGTHLYNKDKRFPEARFEIFAGIAETKPNELYYTACVSDGSLYINGQLMPLQNALGTGYKKQGVMPRGAGWFTKGKTTTSSPVWSSCEIVICKYNQLYWMVFKFDDDELWQYFEDAEESAEIEQIAKIGKITITNDDTATIEQNFCSDIYIGGAGAVVDAVTQPWTVAKDSAGVWQIYAPKINTLTLPAFVGAIDDRPCWTPPAVTGFSGGTTWVPLSTFLPSITDGYLNVTYNPYASGDACTFAIEAEAVADNSRKFTLGKFTVDTNGAVTWVQMLTGAMVFDVTRASPPVVYNEGNGYASDFNVSKYGTPRTSVTFWIEALLCNNTPIGTAMHTDASGAKVFASAGVKWSFIINGIMGNSTHLYVFSGGVAPASLYKIGDVIAKQETQYRVSNIVTNTPTSEDQQGSLVATHMYAYTWVSNHGSFDNGESVLLYTEAEEANIESTYEEAGE